MSDQKKIKGFASEETSFDEGLDIFGEHKTRAQIRAEEKERKKKEREAMRAELENRRKTAREGGITRGKDVLIVVLVLIGIVLVCAIALAVSTNRVTEVQQWEMDASRGHYQNPDATPALSSEGLMADVKEAYFTRNGHLCIELVICNGTDKVQAMEALDVSAFVYETDEQIAGGRAELDEPLEVLVGDTITYTFYIAPEHVMVEDAVIPDPMVFEIAIDHSPTTIE